MGPSGADPQIEQMFERVRTIGAAGSGTRSSSPSRAAPGGDIQGVLMTAELKDPRGPSARLSSRWWRDGRREVRGRSAHPESWMIPKWPRSRAPSISSSGVTAIGSSRRAAPATAFVPRRQSLRAARRARSWARRFHGAPRRTATARGPAGWSASTVRQDRLQGDDLRRRGSESAEKKKAMVRAHGRPRRAVLHLRVEVRRRRVERTARRSRSTNRGAAPRLVARPSRRRWGAPRLT